MSLVCIPVPYKKRIVITHGNFECTASGLKVMESYI